LDPSPTIPTAGGTVTATVTANYTNTGNNSDVSITGLTDNDVTTAGAYTPTYSKDGSSYVEGNTFSVSAGTADDNAITVKAKYNGVESDAVTIKYADPTPAKRR